ncbi:UNVERIFIED_ORG: hypothetical protein J2W74_002038 [Methylorubrum zatmanii]
MWLRQHKSSLYVAAIFAALFTCQRHAFAQNGATDLAKTIDTINSAREMSALTEQPLETTLSTAIKLSNAPKFSTQIKKGILNKEPSDFTSSSGIADLGTPPKLESLEVYQNNVKSAVAEVAASGSETAAPIPIEKQLRVWAGKKVDLPDSYPETVLLAGSGSICTGTLLSPTHVVSAAHCFCRGVSNTVIAGVSVSDVVASALVKKEASYSNIPCEKLKDNDGLLKNIGTGDIALYTLSSPIEMPNLRLIGTEETLLSAASVRAVGFGKTPDSIGGTKFLVDIQIGSYDCSEPEVNSGGKYRCFPTGEMVARGLNRDTCGGDSGGPLYVLGPDVKLYLVAVTSRSLDPSGDCGPGGIYVKLTNSSIRSWLIEKGVPPSAFAASK